MNKAKTTKIFKIAFERTRKENRGFSLSLFCFAGLCLLSFGVAYLDIFSLFLTIPFVVLPAYFAFFAVNSAPELEKGEIGAFFIMWRTYFNRLFFGCFQVIKGFLKALLFSLLFEVVSTSVVEAIIFRNNAEFKNILFDGSKSFEESLQLLESFISENASLQNWLFIISAVSLLTGTLVFISHLAKHSPMLDFSFLRKQPTPMREFNVVNKQIRKEHKKEFSHRLFKGTWFLILLVILGFVSSFLIEKFVFNGNNIDHFFAMGLGISLILVLPFMNYLAQVYHIIFADLRTEYEKIYIKTTLEFLAKYKEKLGIDEEEAKKIEEIVKSQSSNEDKKDKKENKGEK